MMESSSSCSSRASCDSAVNLLPFPVVILERKRIYSYTIPSFCAIKMELQHVFLECGSDAQGLDAFVRVSALSTTECSRVPQRICTT